MSDLVARSDIDSAITNFVPEYLGVFRRFFGDFDDSFLNHSDLTSVLADLPNYFNQFVDTALVPLILYDPKLAAYSSYGIRNLISLSMVDDGPSFFTQFFATFFDRFEIYYADRNETRYETLTGVIYTDDGHVTDSFIFTDQGVGQGCYALMAQIIFSIFERSAVAAKWNDVFAMLAPMKPARLFVYQVPTLDFHINSINPSDPEYDASLATSYTSTFHSIPSRMATDFGLNTDGSPAITTDYTSFISFLQSLSVVKVKYADNPTVLVTLTGTVYVVQKESLFYFAVETSITKEIVYLALSGGFNVFESGVLVPLFIAGFSTSKSMKLRITWTLPIGSGLSP